MNEKQNLDSKMAVLSRLFADATEAASESMGRWTSGEITLTLDRVSEVDLEHVHEAVDIGDDLLTMIVHNLDGELGGQLILTFDDENGRQLAASLLGRDVCTAPEWSPLEISALSETGNILSCAYMKVLTDFIDEKLVPSPPYFVQDYGASILEQAVMAQAMVSDRVLLCHTVFKRGGERLNWCVFFVPTEALLTTFTDNIETVA